MSRNALNQRVLSGSKVVRIRWTPGTDVLEAECHCGARRDFEDPAELWQWLSAHPVGHRLERETAPSPVSSGAPAPAL
jgi:hypothetical protein